MREVYHTDRKRITLIDLSDCLDNATAAFEPNPHRIDYVTPEQGALMAEQSFGVSSTSWPDGVGWAAERVTLTTHSGTHIDAPAHYGPARSGQARTIDQVPLRWCFGDGVVLNMTQKHRGAAITCSDVQGELERYSYILKPYDIVLIRTDTSSSYHQPGYEQRHPGLTREATEWIIDQGVRLIGIDAWSLDRPFDVMISEASQQRSQFWEAHLLGREKEYCQIEKLANLDQLPQPFGFRVVAFPVNLRAASAGWSRVVAIFEDDLALL
ncbi:MAG TPA: cyclase family protein [Ktedonosporobacter sp.]|nr:cyclase family protein [Ktedonosporobacter sp.]